MTTSASIAPRGVRSWALFRGVGFARMQDFKILYQQITVMLALPPGRVRAAASTPVQRLGVVFAHLTQPYQPFPIIVVGSACTSTFSRSHEAMVATCDSGA